MANPFSTSIRVLNAINLLSSPNGTTIKGLMEGLGISRRTAFRLLQSLDELGFPIIDKQPLPKMEKTYCLIDSYVLKLPNITIPNPYLTPEEIIHILAILETCKKYDLIKETQIFNSVKEKLIAILEIRKHGQNK